jgi:hypothetical protein
VLRVLFPSQHFHRFFRILREIHLDQRIFFPTSGQVPIALVAVELFLDLVPESDDLLEIFVLFGEL